MENEILAISYIGVTVVRPGVSFPIEFRDTYFSDTRTGFFLGGFGAHVARGFQKFQKPVRVLSIVGQDNLGDLVLKLASELGISTDIDQAADLFTPITTILLNRVNSDRCNFPDLLWKQIKISDQTWSKWLNRAKNSPLVLFASDEPFRDLFLEVAKCQNTMVAVDLSSAEASITDYNRLNWKPWFDLYLKNARIVFFGGSSVPRDKRYSLVQKMVSAGPQLVVETLSEEGCLVANKDGVQSFPTFIVPESEIVDTTGAGDGFIAGFLSRYLEDPDDLAGCAKRGSLLATAVIRKLGAVNAAEIEI